MKCMIPYINLCRLKPTKRVPEQNDSYNLNVLLFAHDTIYKCDKCLQQKCTPFKDKVVQMTYETHTIYQHNISSRKLQSKVTQF